MRNWHGRKSLVSVVLGLLLAVPACGQFGASFGRGPAGLTPKTLKLYQVSGTNTTWFQDSTGKVYAITGTQSWTTLQDIGDGGTPQVTDFTQYTNFLNSHGHNFTILWKKDLPTWCNWGADSGAVYTMSANSVPYNRSGTSGASDGGNKFDLTSFNSNYFARQRARAIQLGQSGITVIIQLFDGFGINNNRCGTTSPTGDAYPYTGVNNINSVDDGYSSGSQGIGSMNMSAPNAITDAMDALVRHTVDNLNDLQNIVWEVSEEAPSSSNWWQGHMIDLIHAYERGKPYQHLVLYPDTDTTANNDSNLYNSNADVVSPLGTLIGTHWHLGPTNGCSGTGTPVCKIQINDSDHSYGSFWTDTHQVNRNWAWENFVAGYSLLFMDPLYVNWPSSPTRNAPGNVTDGIGTTPDTQYNNFRDNLGAIQRYANQRLDLRFMSAQNSLVSAGSCLADNVATGGEFLIYLPSGGSVNVNLSVQNGRLMNVEWFDPNTQAVNSTTTYTATSSTAQGFTTPGGITQDAVLYIVDAAGHQ